MLATVILVIVVLTAGCTSNVGNTTQSPTPSVSAMAKYDSGNFSIQHPSDWSVISNATEETDTFYVSAATTPFANLWVGFSNLSFNTTLPSWTTTALDTVQNYSKNFTKIDAGNTTLAGNPAYKIVYTETQGLPDKFKVTEIWTVNESRVYTIKYEAITKDYNTYADTFQKMVDSFQIK